MSSNANPAHLTMLRNHGNVVMQDLAPSPKTWPHHPGCPWQNGRIERLFGTLKEKLDLWQVPNFAQLNIDLDMFLHWYNHVRPHQNLDGKTPAEAWRGQNPYTKPPKQEHWFEAWDGLLAGYCLRY